MEHFLRHKKGRNLPSFRDIENHGFEMPKVLKDLDSGAIPLKENEMVEAIALEDDNYPHTEIYY